MSKRVNDTESEVLNNSPLVKKSKKSTKMPKVKQKIENTKRFVCEHCSKNIATGWGLKVHLKQHSAVEYYYQCPYCAHLANIQGNLMQHIAKVHTKKTVTQIELRCFAKDGGDNTIFYIEIHSFRSNS